MVPCQPKKRRSVALRSSNTDFVASMVSYPRLFHVLPEPVGNLLTNFFVMKWQAMKRHPRKSAVNTFCVVPGASQLAGLGPSSGHASPLEETFYK
jgi:hypothetical protein